jgi:hypothetical protein
MVGLRICVAVVAFTGHSAFCSVVIQGFREPALA